MERTFDSQDKTLDEPVVEDKKDHIADVVKMVAEAKSVPKENEPSSNVPKSTMSRMWESNKILTDQNKSLAAENAKLREELATLKTHANDVQIVAQKKVETTIRFDLNPATLDELLNGGWQVMLLSFDGAKLNGVFLRDKPDEKEPDISQVGISERPALLIRGNLSREGVQAKVERKTAELNGKVWDAMFSPAS